MKKNKLQQLQQQLHMKEFPLIPESVDSAAELVESFLQSWKVEKSAVIKLRINVEETLLEWLSVCKENDSFQLSFGKGYGQYKIQLRYKGAPCNPLTDSDSEFGSWTKSMLSKLEAMPVYAYKHGINMVTFSMPRPKLNSLKLIMAALAASIPVGLLGSFIPTDVKSFIVNECMTPVYSTYLDVFAFCGIPLIFLSVVLGILGVEDLPTFTKIGKKMVLRFATIIVSVILISIIFAAPLFNLSWGSDRFSLSYSDFISMVLGWLPTNLFQPFISMNAMQLIIMGAIFGIGMLVLGSGTGTLQKTLEDVNNLLLWFAQCMTRLIPFFVFIMVVKSIWMSELDVLLPAWKSWVVTTGLQALFVLCMVLAISRRYKTSFKLILKKISKTFLIALGTNSCTASIPENYACCAGKLGIDSKVFTFGIPIGTSIFKPATAIRLVLLSLFMAAGNNVQVSLSWMIMLFIMSFTLSIAIPAIPGGTMMFCTMLFTQLGIPVEVLAQMLATDIFFDAICTAFNQISVQLALLQHAGSIGLLDKDLLQKPMQTNN